MKIGDSEKLWRECWGDSNIRVQRGVPSTLVLEVGGKGGDARVIKWTVMRLFFVLPGPLKEAVTKHPWAANLGRELLFSVFKTESLEAASE